MRVLPILFQPAMVRAILREVRAPGTGKTETRRIIKPEAKGAPKPGDILISWPAKARAREGSRFRPRWQVGDLLYVRESFHLDGGEVAYMADHPGDPAGLGWRPSIHLPRASSRLTLKVTGVRVERLQSCTDAGALAEGVERINRSAFMGGGTLYAVDGGSAHDTPVGAYNALWRKINGDGSWAANPWVVVIKFLPMLVNVDVALREAA